MSAWRDLPNAHHIDRVIESLKIHWNIWAETWASSYGAAWDAALNEVRGASREAAWDAAFYATRRAARHTVHLDAAWDAILALVAWDDSAQFLDMTSDELEVWARLSNDPRVILLLPAVQVFEQIKSLKTV